MVSRLEPIIFVIIGYYFGRLPSQQNESTLKDEINRQTQKADAAQHAKEQAQQARESLEEKMKNVRAALATSSSRLAENPDKASGSVKDDNPRQSSSRSPKHSKVVILPAASRSDEIYGELSCLSILKEVLGWAEPTSL